MMCPYCKEGELEMYIGKAEGFVIVCRLCSAEWKEVKLTDNTQSEMSDKEYQDLMRENDELNRG